MSNIFTKGSEWRKWDLHAHTPIDHEWINKPDLTTEEKKKDFAKKYIEFARQEGLEVIGITDHNFCNQISELILPYIIEEATANSITICPGFEITVKDGSGIHVLVLFKEHTLLKEIHEVVKRLFPLGTILIPSNGTIPVCENDLDDLKLILDGSKLDYLLIFAHADRENGVLDKSTIVGERRIQEWQKKYISVCQLSKAKEDFPAGCFVEAVIKKTNTHYARNITYIVSSDCRSISKADLLEGRHYLGQKFTWIKADPTFEGLKQIVFEPDSRVRVQEDKPEQKTPYLTIDKVRFISDNDDKTFQKKEIGINNNLNSIIGGKSSGKSLLLYYIGKAIDPKQIEEKYDELEITDRYNYENEIIAFDFEVTWNDGTVYKLSDEQDRKTRQITYIPQMYINHLAEKRGNEELKKLIQSILEEKPQFLEFNNTCKDLISNFKGNIGTNVFNYFEQKKKLAEIIGQLRAKGDKDARQENLRIKKDELSQLRNESGFSEEEEKDYQLQLSNRTIHDLRKQNLESFLEILNNNYNIELKGTFDVYSKNLDKTQTASLNKFVSNELLKNIFEKKTNEFKTMLLTPYQFVKEDIDKMIVRIKSWINYTDEKINIYNERLTPYLNKIVKKEKLEEIQKAITSEELILSQIAEIENQELLAQKHLEDYKLEILKYYSLMMEEYQKIVSEINSKYSEINKVKNIKLKAILSFDSDRFFNGCTKQIAKYSSFTSIFGTYFSNYDFVFTEATHLTDLKAFFEKILTGDIKYNHGGSQNLVCEKMFDDYFIVDFEIFQKDESIFRMSPGKKGLILLYLILHLSNAEYPILIDQPEDNLDNRTVYKELKDFIKSKKIERQIIIVTHNANLVVPTDSENVIVANQSGQDQGKDNETYKFEYASGSLENSFISKSATGILNQMGIREHVCEILEGGEDAFKERELRYDLD